MNREDIIRMAKEAGYQEDMFGFGIWDSKEFNIFVDLVETAERKECIKLCKWLADRYPESDASSCVDIISLRGKE